MVVQGLRLEYLDLPASRPGGPVLVLLHEGLGCVAMWRDFPQRLAAATGCRVVAWSRAGYGGSDPSDTPRRPDYLEVEARQGLPATLAALGLERPVLVGHSDGATLALLFAGSFPGSVAGVVAMSPHEFVEPETLAGLRQALQAWETTNGGLSWTLRGEGLGTALDQVIAGNTFVASTNNKAVRRLRGAYRAGQILLVAHLVKLEVSAAANRVDVLRQ